ncbi:unnamed protein product [Urochloa humidicola]
MASGFAPFERRWTQLRRSDLQKGEALEEKGEPALEKKAVLEKVASLGVEGRMAVGSAPPQWWSLRVVGNAEEGRASFGFDPLQRWSFKAREQCEEDQMTCVCGLLQCALEVEAEALGGEGLMDGGFALAAALSELDPMAVGYGLQRCSLKMAVVGEMDPMKGFSAESKDKVEVVEAGCIEGDKPAEVMAVAGENKAPAARKGLTPLPKEEVDCVLSWKRGRLTSGHATLEEIEAFEATNDSFAKYQAWMRAEYEANKGVVLVDDEFLKKRAENRQSMKDFWDQMDDDEDDNIDFSGWNISDLRSDFYNDESEEEDEEGEGEEEAVQEFNTN